MMKINKDLFFGFLIFLLALTLKLFPAFDLFLLKFLNSFLFNENFFSYFTELGNGWFTVALIIPTLSFISFRSKKMTFVPIQALIISGIYIGIIVQILKEEIFHFTRPALDMIEGINYLEPIFRYAGFPSGHASTIFGVMLIWLHLALQENKKESSKSIYFLAIGFAISVALSRVVIAAHWFTDILASLGLILIVRSALSFDKFKLHLMESNIGKYLSYFIVSLAWAGILFFDITEYF